MIEQANKDDIEEVYELICLLENKQINKSHFQKVFCDSISRQDIYFLVYKLDNRIIGFMSLYIHCYLHHHRDTMEIVELVVDPHYRRQHIGKQFLDYAYNLALKHNLEEIDLSTSIYRKDAHRFYENNGFIKNHYNYTKEIKTARND